MMARRVVKLAIAVHYVKRGATVTGCGLVTYQSPTAVWVGNKRLTTCSVCLGQLPLPGVEIRKGGR